MNRNIAISAAAAAAAMLAPAAPALAHPATATAAGLTAGLTHPLLGLDHLIALLAVGCLAARYDGRAQLAPALAFIAMIAVGALVGALAGALLPAAPLIEFGIAGSLVLFGGLIALEARLPIAAVTVLAAVAALFHGQAHGAEMPLTANGLAFGAGLLATSSVVIAGGMFAGRLTRQLGVPLATRALGRALGRIMGWTTALAGVSLLAVT